MPLETLFNLSPMEQPNQPKSEATPATQNLVKASHILRAWADAIDTDKVKTWTEIDVNKVAFTVCDLLRSWGGCSVSLTTPLDVIEWAEGIEEDEESPVQLNLEEAKQVCRWIEDNRYLNEIQGEVFTDACAEALRVKKGGAK